MLEAVTRSTASSAGVGDTIVGISPTDVSFKWISTVEFVATACDADSFIDLNVFRIIQSVATTP